MPDALLDTGVLVALLDRAERNHARCVAAFATFRGELLTTEPVLTEAIYLLNKTQSGQTACLDFILDGGANLIHQSATSLRRGKDLMHRYRDVPMDFADATLVTLAEETGIRDIFSLDLRGFTAYRIDKHMTFKIYPGYSN